MHPCLNCFSILAGEHSCPNGAAAKESRAVCLQAAGAETRVRCSAVTACAG